jgi:hypothetical protein
MDGMGLTEGMMKGSDGQILRFYYEPAKNEGASVHAGRPIFDTVLYVDIITPGQSHSTPSFEVERVWAEQSKAVLNTEDTCKRSPKYAEYAEQIEKFKRGENVGDLGGTPLKHWPRIDRGLAATLAAANIHTVEALAGVSDGNLQHIGMGARELREQAKAFLAQAAGDAPVSQLTDQVATLRSENQRLQTELVAVSRQVTELNAQLAVMQGKPPPVERKLADITLS